MGYLDNSSRTLDAILTKKGREILSSGGDFEVTKFALGDDEVDYALWDTTHTQGTDYYGAVIDNLPALEPFNDPSEIMKYKLVTRQEGTSAMVKLNNYTNPGTNTITLNWYSDITSNSGISVNPSSPDPDNPNPPENPTNAVSLLGGGDNASQTLHISRAQNSTDDGYGNLDFDSLEQEPYTVTVLDSSVAILAPEPSGGQIDREGDIQVLTPQDLLWVPFVDNVQHISQTLKGCSQSDAEVGLRFPFSSGQKGLRLYPKKISSSTETSVIVTGDLSGAVLEFNVTVTYNS